MSLNYLYLVVICFVKHFNNCILWMFYFLKNSNTKIVLRSK